MQILSCMYALYTQWDHAVYIVSSTIASMQVQDTRRTVMSDEVCDFNTVNNYRILLCTVAPVSTYGLFSPMTGH